jgi:hypothetical protein
MRERTLPSIHIVLKPSFIILGLYLLISILSCLSIVISPLAILIKLLSLILVILSLVYIILRDVLLVLPWSWQSINIAASGELRLLNNRQQQLTVAVLPSTFNHPWLTVLNFKRTTVAMGWRSSVVLTRWQVHDRQAYRRLRVWLKWWPHQAEDDALAVLVD